MQVAMDTRTPQVMAAKRKFQKWLFKLNREEASSGCEQRMDPPDVADIVEVLRAAGFRLCSVDLGEASCAGGGGGAAGEAQGCRVSVRCPKSGLSVTMEAPGDADCRCPTAAHDNASTWCVTSLVSNKEEVGSSLLPRAPAEVSEVLGSALSCALRLLREWRSGGRPGTPPPPPLSPRPRPPPPAARRRSIHASLDAAQWAAKAALAVAIPAASPWIPSAPPATCEEADDCGPSQAASGAVFDPNETYPLSPSSSEGKSSCADPQPSGSDPKPGCSADAGPPPVPPRPIYTLDDVLRARRSAGASNAGIDTFQPFTERSVSVSDFRGPQRAAPSEPKSIQDALSLRDLPSGGREMVQGTVKKNEEFLFDARDASASPKNPNLILPEESDFLDKAQTTIRHVGSLMQAVRKLIATRQNEEKSYILMNRKDSKQDLEAENELKKTVRRLLPTLSSEPKQCPAATPSTSRLSRARHRLDRLSVSPVRDEDRPIAMRTFIRPKKDQESKSSGSTSARRQTTSTVLPSRRPQQSGPPLPTASRRSRIPNATGTPHLARANAKSMDNIRLSTMDNKGSTSGPLRRQASSFLSDGKYRRLPEKF